MRHTHSGASVRVCVLACVATFACGNGTDPGSQGTSTGGAATATGGAPSSSGGGSFTGGGPATGGGSTAGGLATGGSAAGGSTGASGAATGGGSTTGGSPSGGGEGAALGMLGVTPKTSVKPRVIATTDGELDDTSSMNRFLAYASDYEIAGIVQVNSSFQKDGHSKDKWIEKQIAAYGECLPNLRKHRPDYPSTEELLSALTVGNEVSGDLGKSPDQIADSPGAQLIIKTLLDDDPRPVHILAWGGTNTQANALWQLKNDPKYTDADYQKASSKAVLYCIWFQDAGGGWITKNLPDIKIYGAGTPGRRDDSWRYVWDYMSVSGKWKGRASANPPDLQTIMDTPWLMANVKKDHGPLGAAYTQDYTSEGDTPSFMPLIDNGLDQASDYTLGGWGGRPHYDSGGYMKDSADELNGKSDAHWTFQRWLPAAQNDWASRNDWCVADTYEAANHQPDARVAGPLLRKAPGGSTATLDASPTMDPDGDEVTFKWWQYHEADSASAKVEITGAGTKTASFVVPSEAGKQVHIILEVVDKGTPPLTRYQRIIYDIE